MLSFFKTHIEQHKVLRLIELLLILLLLLCSLSLLLGGLLYVFRDPGEFSFAGLDTFTRDMNLEEEYSEDNTQCEAVYVADVGSITCHVSYSYEDYCSLDEDATLPVVIYTAENLKDLLIFPKDSFTASDLIPAVREAYLETVETTFHEGFALLILMISLMTITFFSTCFSTYEKIWFISIMFAATLVAIFVPEESANGISGIWIMLLYLLDTFCNILCELLISKQSRWNFIVSLAVELLEIAMSIVLMYRFATMVVTLLFWIPIDIVSFINWTKHKDEDQEELTQVRKLSGLQEVLIIGGIVLWTGVVGYFLSGLDIATDLFSGNKTIETLVCYLDACASAVGIANGLFIFFRFREQWIAWYICAFLEAIINILSFQWVLLILKIGYFTNTTYGYIRWTRYIQAQKDAPKKEFF